MSSHRFVDDTPARNWSACIAPHAKDPQRPRTASHGLLCAGHHASLEQHLAELPALLDEVEAALVRGGTGLGPKISGSPTRPLPFVEAVSDALSAAQAVLASWCLLVLEEHPDGLHAPHSDTPALSRFLLTHLAWCAAQPWADDLVREIDETRRGLSGVLTPSRTRRVPLGPCERPLTCDVETHLEVRCDGTLTAVVHTLDDTLPGAITCPACGDSHPPETWRPLARRLRGGAEAWLTYAQLSQLLRVPIGTLHRWAAEEEWRRLDGRPVRFHHDDAQATYERLREAS